MKTINSVRTSKFRSGFPRERRRIVKIMAAERTSILISINTIFLLREAGCEPAIVITDTMNKIVAAI